MTLMWPKGLMHCNWGKHAIVCNNRRPPRPTSESIFINARAGVKLRAVKKVQKRRERERGRDIEVDMVQMFGLENTNAGNLHMERMPLGPKHLCWHLCYNKRKQHISFFKGRQKCPCVRVSVSGVWTGKLQAVGWCKHTNPLWGPVKPCACLPCSHTGLGHVAYLPTAVI